MPNVYTIPQVNDTQGTALTPYGEGMDNIQHATELYKFLILTHCKEFLDSNYVGMNYTERVRYEINANLNALTMDTPYIASISGLRDITVSLTDRR